MQFIVLSILEISCLAIAISHAAEIRESSIRKEPGGVRPFIGWWTADLLKTEAGQHARLLQNFSRIFVGDGEHDRIGDAQWRVFRIGKTATGKHRHKNKDAIRICGIVPEKEFMRRAVEIVRVALR